MTVRIFLSCVSDEFLEYRDQLRGDLTRRNVEVKVQEDFKDYGTATLVNLDGYIAECDAVIHLLGDMIGAAPRPPSVETLLKKHPDLRDKLPSLREAMDAGVTVSYTQWEAWLALYHDKLLLIAKAGDEAPRGPRHVASHAAREAQADHLNRLRTGHDRYPGCIFTSPDSLAKSALSSAILDLLAKAGRASEPAAAAAAAPDRPARCFGREDETAELVSALLGAPAAALVLGGAGMGKTTLTLEAATHPDVVARYGQRRWVVPLETALNGAALEAEVVKALGLDPATTRLDAALARLAGVPALVVLDNLETPWEADRLAVEASLKRIRAVEAATLLASIRGGDAPADLRWKPRIAVVPLGESDARKLFHDIAPGIAEDDPHLAPLLADLGGVPLAIELVALQAAPFANLDDLWAEWLRRGSALAARRGVERSRLSSLDRSLELSLGSPRVGEAGRRLFALLGRLPAGIAATDRDALLGEAGFTAAAELLSTGLAPPGDGGRIDLLPPVRDHARRHHLPSDEDERRWRLHYLDLVREVGSQVQSAAGAAAVARLAPEIPNIEAALRGELESDVLAAAVAAMYGIGRLMATTGQGSPTGLRSAAKACSMRGDPAGQARCLDEFGDIALARSDHDAARKAYDDALPLYRQVGDILGQANCIKSLGDIALERSDHDAARKAYEMALPLYRQVGNILGEANCIWRLGDIALERSDHDAARKAYDDALPLYRQVGEIIGEANCIQRLGDIALARSDHDAARKAYQDALPLYRQVGSVLGEANCIRSLGDIALDRSDHDAARKAYETALPLFRQVGQVLGEANCIKSLGDIALARSDYDAARKAYQDALAMYEQIHEPYSVGWTQVWLARLAGGQERAERLAAARAAWTAIDRPDLLAELDAIERGLGEEPG